MEDSVKTERLSRKRKSIEINTVMQSPSASSSPAIAKSRRSILKNNLNKSFSTESTSNEIAQINGIKEPNCTESQKLSSPTPNSSIPHTIEELIQMEKLVPETLPSTLTLEDLENLSDDVEIWIMNVPATIDPQELEEQIITFGGETEFKIQDKQYSCIESRDKDSDVTCVLRTRKDTQEYKTVSIKPAGVLTVRKKLHSEVPKVKPIPVNYSAVQIPENLKQRHPSGVTRQRKKRSRKHNSLKKNGKD